jgi:hypothetical protein
MPRPREAYDPPLRAAGQLNRTAPLAGEVVDLVTEGALRELGDPGSGVFERPDTLLFQNLSDTERVFLHFTGDLLGGGFWTLLPSAIAGFRLENRRFAARGESEGVPYEVMVLRRL